MKIKILASVILAGFLICVTNLNVFATEEVITDTYQDFYEPGLKMNIEETEKKYKISSEDNSIYWSAEKVERERYTSCAVFARKTSPNINKKDELCLEPGEAITLVGISPNGWDIIKYNNELYFMWYEYITEDAPVKIKEATLPEMKNIKKQTYFEECTEIGYDPEYFQYMGVIYWGGYRWTYYSQRVLPGPGLEIPGRHVGKYGFVCDENEYICLASNDLSWGTVVDTPFGMKGRVYDCGCASGTLDCYCDW